MAFSQTHLGIILDTEKFESRLPDDKREDLLRLLEDMIERKHCTLKELEHLLGKLQFASRVVIPGRTFLRRLYDAAGHATQSFHRVRRPTACRMDLRWWVQTDAAASVGFGAICGGEWFSGCWSDLQSRCCITYMELYPIALACSTWGHKWTAKRIEFLTDNQAVAACITSGTCRCGNVMSLLRALFFVCAKNNCQITATYFPGSTNTIADALSRQEWDRFCQLALKLGSHPRRSPVFPVFRGRPLFSRALLCPASISASHQEGVHGWPGPFSQILLSTRSGAPASNRTNIGGVYRLFGRRGAMRTCHN